MQAHAGLELVHWQATRLARQAELGFVLEEELNQRRVAAPRGDVERGGARLGCGGGSVCS